MKYYFLFLTILFLSCKKDSNPPFAIDALIINDAEFTGENKFAVGQYLKFAPFISTPQSGIDLSWTISPAEPIEIGNSQIRWRPAQAQKYTLSIDVKANSGKQASKEYTFETIPADVRYNLWGSSIEDVQYNENANLSERLGDWQDHEGAYLVKNSSIYNGRNDAVQPGELIWYVFDKSGLLGADVYVPVQKSNNFNTYLDIYEKIKLRLSEYDYLGQKQQWINSDIAQQYQNNQSKWGEAFMKGYLIITDLYGNERTNIRLELAGGEDGSASIVIHYSKAQ